MLGEMTEVFLLHRLEELLQKETQDPHTPPPHLPQSPENKQPTYIFGAYKCGSESDCPGIYQHATAWLGV